MTRISLVLFAVALIAPASARAVSIGLLDTFQDGTTQNWDVGGSNPTPPQNVAGGGPRGAADAYMLLTADKQSSGGKRIVANNSDQWSGDYLGPGVSAIVADMNNFSGTELHMRLALDGSGGTISIIEPVILPPASGWTRVVLPLSVDEMTTVEGGTNVFATLSSVSLVRITHRQTPGFSGDAVTATLGIDNFRAVPEPSGLVVVCTCGLALRRRRWRFCA